MLIVFTVIYHLLSITAPHLPPVDNSLGKSDTKGDQLEEVMLYSAFIFMFVMKEINCF